MKRRMFIAAVPVLALALASCGPLTYTLPVEKRSDAAGNVDFGGKLPGIVSLVPRGDSDSTLMSVLAIGIAEGLEADLDLDSGAVPVYSMYADEVNLDDRAVVEYLHAAVGVDFLIVTDSMTVGELTVEIPQEKAYVDGAFMQQSIVSLPYAFRIQVFDITVSGPVERLTQDDVLQWTLLSDAPLTRLRAVERVGSELDGSFRAMGRNAAERFTPKWETVNMMLYVYDDRDWTEACRLAYLFEWEKAMDIWYKEAESPNLRKAACAAHNLSVACGILGMDNMAEEWKARSEELMKQY